MHVLIHYQKQIIDITTKSHWVHFFYLVADTGMQIKKYTTKML